MSLYRQAGGRSQVAAILDLSTQALSQWATGATAPTRESFLDLVCSVQLQERAELLADWRQVQSRPLVEAWPALGKKGYATLDEFLAEAIRERVDRLTGAQLLGQGIQSQLAFLRDFERLVGAPPTAREGDAASEEKAEGEQPRPLREEFRTFLVQRHHLSGNVIDSISDAIWRAISAIPIAHMHLMTELKRSRREPFSSIENTAILLGRQYELLRVRGEKMQSLDAGVAPKDIVREIAREKANLTYKDESREFRKAA